MSTNLLTLNSETDIYQAVDFLLKYKISGAPVVDEINALIGIISEKDCLQLLQDNEKNLPQNLKVRDLMSSKVNTLLPDTDIYSAAGIFLKSNYRRFPVVNNAGKLVGQISRRDILRAIQENIKGKNIKEREMGKNSKIIKKEDVGNLNFPKGDVLVSVNEIEVRKANLEKAAMLGNSEKHKVNIVFSAQEGLFAVNTTVWAVGSKFISLKGGISIPINRIYEIAN